MYSGRVRALLDERGKTVKSAGPAIPVQVLGIQGVPMAGDQLLVVEDADGGARNRAAPRASRPRSEEPSRHARWRRRSRTSWRRRRPAMRARCSIVIKADQGGPAEALADALDQLVDERSEGRGHSPRRRRDHRERHPARARVGRDHHRLPRASGQQRAHRGRARRRRHQAVPHHLRSGGRRSRRARRHAASRGARGRARRGRSARGVQGLAHRHHRRLLGPQRRHQSPGPRARHSRRRRGLRRHASRRSSASRTT